ncbi:MAG: hypothetical protein IPL78_08360 [Chloroflexi bacterium]|nr:hypothetical protein [Chloroflexota bacterium]
MKQWLSLVMIFVWGWLLVACEQTPAAMPTVAAIVTEVTATPAAATPSPSPTPIPSPLPSATPNPTATPVPPTTVSAMVGVPPELIAAAQTLISQHPDQFTWLDDPAQADLRLAIAPATSDTLPGPVLAHWIFALVVAFPTIPDELPLAQVQNDWQAGQLILDEPTQALLRLWWGEPTAAASPIPTDQLVTTLWDNRPALSLIPFPALEPALKVLRPDGQPSPIDLDFDPATYPLAVPIFVEGEDGERGRVGRVVGRPYQ